MVNYTQQSVVGEYEEDRDPALKAPNSRVPVGAVLVVGGGIAGMQSALDMAESGYKVYLLEKSSAIGGHMSQLDKTFPTNDCAMCTVAPRLVEVGRHPNITLLTNSEVLALRGEAGDFEATIRRNPRYVDVEKCTACGDCARVCPVVIPDPFNEGLSQRRAAYKLYPQAIPNAFAIEKRGIAPCRDACPAGQRAQGYIALIHEGRYQEALRTIKEDNPFPGICGRICSHRCELACNRGKVDEPINIHALKRFVTDQIYAGPRTPVAPAPRKYNERVAIIGAGPCGLTAAQDLCKQGYGVTVFEALPVAGGMLRVGVPEFRLPTSIIEREVQDIVDLGVDLRLNSRVDNLDELFAQGYSSVIVTVGAHQGRTLPIDGADLQGVLVNTSFLRDVRLGNAPDLSGKRVLVLGGGNVAIDVARTAVRLWAAEVHMAFPEKRETMPAHTWEVEDAESEGIGLHPARSFKRILGNGDGRVTGLECLRVLSMAFDDEGRLNLETEPGSEEQMDCDVVIFSIGQRADLTFIPESCGVAVTRQATIAANPNTLAATRPGVFAAGDVTTGTSFVIDAIAAGHCVAGSVHRYLRSEELEPPPKPELPVVNLTHAELYERMQSGEIQRQPRVPMPTLSLGERRTGFGEVERGYSEAEAKAEAERCLACGICSECLSCLYECKIGAINHDEAPRTEVLHVGAVVLAPGYQAYRAEMSEEYGWGRYPNVVTALQFERLLSASGPTQGHVTRPSDGKPARRIAFLQCVGSRDQTHDYCSAVCCMYAAKEAVMAREHDPEVRVTIFFMDVRSFSKGYEGYYRRAQEQYGLRLVRCRVSTVKEDPRTRNLVVRYVGDGPEMDEESYDLVVLSVGMEISPAVRDLGRRVGVELDDYGFCNTLQLQPLQTSKPGIYAVGPFREPKDIPETVIDASGAAALAGGLLHAARGTLVSPLAYPPERDVTGEEPRVGVFVCHCGSNIGGFLDVPGVAEYARGLPNVVHAEDNLYTCSQNSIRRIAEETRELGLNRVVVASCTPLTHAPLFQDSIRQAGLNPFLFEMANIRNQCSWVHSHDWDRATAKAKDLVRSAVARASELEPLQRTQVPVTGRALVIGGGAAGMNAALALAEQGIQVDLIERDRELGGNLRYTRYLADTSRQHFLRCTPQTTGWLDAREYLGKLVEQVHAQPLITVHLETELLETHGYKGNFTSRLSANGNEITIEHGATIVATGAREYRGPDYGYGQDPRIVTQQEFEAALEELDSSPEAKPPRSVVMIQCVGPAERYCSRTCCSVALKNSLRLKARYPNSQVTILYRDLRTYGFKERLYTEARRLGVAFVRYVVDRKPEVCVPESGDAGRSLQVHAWEPVLGREMILEPDLVVLSMPMVPNEGAEELARRLRVSVDLDGWLTEAHVKLRPVDFSTEGLYMAGAVHYPKLLDETIAQAQAAAARAATILTRSSLAVGGSIARVNPEACAACLTCVRVCPFGVPQVQPGLSGVGGVAGAVSIEPALCQGCGVCVAECPARAIELLHCNDSQMLAKVEALL